MGRAAEEAGFWADGPLSLFSISGLSGLPSSTQLMKYTPDSWSCDSRFPITYPPNIFPVSPPQVLCPASDWITKDAFLVTRNSDVAQAGEVSVGHWEAQLMQEMESAGERGEPWGGPME